MLNGKVSDRHDLKEYDKFITAAVQTLPFVRILNQVLSNHGLENEVVEFGLPEALSTHHHSSRMGRSTNSPVNQTTFGGSCLRYVPAFRSSPGHGSRTRDPRDDGFKEG